MQKGADTDGTPSSEAVTIPESPAGLGLSFVRDWDRYEMIHFVGRGGMGSVFKARDRRLDRVVAIKFVLGESPSTSQRFVHEARAQARVEHPNVCRVLEVGEVSGRSYIALQFVDGEPLHRAAAQMSLDEKIAVVRDVARAIDEAHQTGVIHRDLKPGNVLVERRADGRWFPVVVDFGLAREVTFDVDQARLTQTGVLLGTPAYMSPEQARGDTRAVDERSDVYSLGATLFEILTGRVPYSDPSPTPLLVRVGHESLPSPRAINPALPRELEAVTLRCLARDPAQRYRSARELADDLGRYLAGEVVLGHRPSTWRRTRLLVRRHRALATTSALAIVSLAALVTVTIRAEIADQQAQQLTQAHARLVEQLGRDAAEIEAALREAYLRPLHDVRPERRQVVDRMHAIEEARRGDAGSPRTGDAEVLAALGRGHLALGQWREAVDRLRAARRAGLDTPTLHAALGRALGELYREEADRVSGAPGERDAAAWVVARRGELVQRYLTPALQELRDVRGPTGEEAALLAARIALYARDLPAAERGAREVADADPGSSEARQIIGEAAYLAAVEDADHGDYASATPKLARAAQAYAAAIRIARSDAALYRAAAQTSLQIAEAEHRQGRPAANPLHHALELVEQGALVADPDDASAYATEADAILRTYWMSLGPPSVDEASLLDRAVDAAAHAVALGRDDSRNLSVLGIAELYRGGYEFFHGEEGTTWWRRALDQLNQALTRRPGDPRLLNAIGMTHTWLGEEAGRTGQDPSEEYRLARRSYDQALDADPRYLRASTNRVSLLAMVVEKQQSRGADPSLTAQATRDLGRDCLLSHPSSYVALNALARVELAVARWSLSRGDDPSASLTRVRELLGQAAAALPRSTEVSLWQAEAARIEADYLTRRGDDTDAILARGRASAQQALHNTPDSAIAHLELALLDLVEARRRKSKSLLADAQGHASRAIAINPRLPEAWIAKARTWRELASPGNSTTALERATEAITQALRLNPTNAEAQKLSVEIQHLRGEAP